MPSTSAVETTHRTLENYNHLISPQRDTGAGYYLSARRYPSGDAEVVALRLSSDDSLIRGGGAKRKNKEKEKMDLDVLEKSSRRAKTTVRRKCLTMQCDRLLTLTFRENLKDIDIAWQRFHYFNKLMRHKFPRYQYVAVPEYQKRGAVHFHLAIRGYYPVKIVRKLWRRAVGQLDGNIDITPPKRVKKGQWNPSLIANYLAKYLSKHDSVHFNRRRYSTGGGIQVPSAMTGWLAISLDKDHTVSTLQGVMSGLSGKDIRCCWESENWLGIIYLST